MNELNLTPAQKQELGKKMKYLGGNVIDIHEHILKGLQDVWTLFDLVPVGKKDDRVTNKTFDLLYDEVDMNWGADGLSDRTIFYKFFDIIEEIGILHPDFKHVRIHAVQAMKMAKTVLPAPESGVGSRIVFNLGDSTCLLLTETVEGGGFYVRKYLPRNTFVLLGNAQHLCYYLISQAGPYVFKPKLGTETLEKHHTDLKVPKKDNYNRLTLAIDIYNTSTAPEEFVKISEGVNILKKKKRRRGKNANKISKEEKEALDMIKSGLQKTAGDLQSAQSTQSIPI